MKTRKVPSNSGYDFGVQEGGPSRTALRVAMRRAAHQLFDHPPLFEDPIAVPIIGREALERVKQEHARHGSGPARSLRAFLVARSKYAEDMLAAGLKRGVTQYVILGAGLDTFAYRHDFSDSSLRVFEVDHPATQEWKRRRIQAASIGVPPSLTYVPVDFETQTLDAELTRTGFDQTKPSFFSWLGVTMYLTEDSVMSTLRFIANVAAGGGVVFDYAVARSSLNWLNRIVLDRMSNRVAAVGEPFRTFFDPTRLQDQLRSLGFTSVEDFDANAINARYFTNRADGLKVRGSLGRLIHAL